MKDRKIKPGKEMILICLGTANLLLAAGGLFFLAGENRNLLRQIQELQVRVSQMEGSVTDTVRGISAEIQRGQERADSFVDQFLVTVTPKDGLRAEILAAADLKEYREGEEVYFIWEGAEGTVNLPAVRSDGTQFQAETEVSALTESGILKIYKKSGEEIKGEILEHVSVKDACFIQMDCSGFLGWSSWTGKTEVELSPDVSLFTVSVPEDVYLTRAEVQTYIENEMIQAQNLLETEKTSGAEGDTAWMEGTDSIYTASWNMKLSLETGDRIDLRIAAEDSNGTVYSAVAARGIVQEENGLLSITEEPSDQTLHIEPEGEKAWQRQ